MPYLFNTDINSPLRCIHPVQVTSVSNLLDCKFPSEINYAIVFGGSVLPTCHPHSDIDLYFVGNIEMDVSDLRSYFRKYRRHIGKPLDILYSKESDFLELRKRPGNVENKVWEEGVVIYAKGACDITGSGKS